MEKLFKYLPGIIKGCINILITIVDNNTCIQSWSKKYRKAFFSPYITAHFISDTLSLPACLSYIKMFLKGKNKGYTRNLSQQDRVIIWFINDWNWCSITFLCFPLLNEKTSMFEVLLLNLFILSIWGWFKKLSKLQI